MEQIPYPVLLEKLSILAATPDPDNLDHAFWTDESELAWAARDGLSALVQLAQYERIGWELQCNWRCDVPDQMYAVRVLDDKLNDAHPHEAPDYHLQSATPHGAMAMAILIILQDRASTAKGDGTGQPLPNIDPECPDTREAPADFQTCRDGPGVSIEQAALKVAQADPGLDWTNLPPDLKKMAITALAAKLKVEAAFRAYVKSSTQNGGE